MSKQSPVGKTDLFKEHMEHHSERVAVLSLTHLVQRNICCGASCLHSVHPFLPAFSSSKCLSLFMLTPHPVAFPSLPFPSLSSSWSEGLCTIQTKHHQPPPDSHQRALFCVAFPPLIKNMTLSYLPLSPSTTQLYFG